MKKAPSCPAGPLEWSLSRSGQRAHTQDAPKGVFLVVVIMVPRRSMART